MARKQNESLADHARQDKALSSSNENDDHTKKEENRGTTILGRIAIFLALPAVVGFVSLYVGYLETSRKDSLRDLSFEQDFALPFALALALCLVIGFQTRGFTRREVTPLVAWPKVQKRRKVVHKYVVKGQNDGPDDMVDSPKTGESKKNE